MIITLNPDVGNKSKDFGKYCKSLELRFAKCEEENLLNTLFDLSGKLISHNQKNLSDNELALLTAKSILLDLLAQGWILQTSASSIQLKYNNNKHLSIEEEKSRIRKGHLFQRNRQLLEKSVKEFIEKCERKRLTKYGWQSIFSLMRDGIELSEKLRNINLIQDESDRLNNLSDVIKPYIQFAEKDKIDEFTSIPLLDIWRYFRHTWITPYKVLPGRSMAILIRDAGAPNHPVIGIAALGSSVAQFTQRDKWIGWDAETFIQNITENPSNHIGRYLLSKLANLLSLVYKKDLVKEKIITKDIINNPTEAVIRKLIKMSGQEIESHRKENKEIFNRLKQNGLNGKTDWEFYSNTSLYKSKRYRTLSTLLNIRLIFNKYYFTTGTTKELTYALKHSPFRNAVGQLIRKIKGENVGIKMMDIIVCGALPPYNHLLGGKLVCALLLSPEIVKYYKAKYTTSLSIIASSMSGKKVRRDQDLVLLNTTSLYGVGSSQYNRIKIPLSNLDYNNDQFVEYKNLGFSKGFGSFQFSKQTIDLIHHLIGRKGEGRIVNSIFGEGANPLLRKIREGLELIDFPSEDILRHGNQRVLYGVALAKNFKEILLGIQKNPKYLITLSKPKLKTELLSQYWIRRWLSNRIRNEKVIEGVSQHTLEYPITHGARVPKVQEELSLFD